jgi:hypothetical protein
MSAFNSANVVLVSFGLVAAAIGLRAILAPEALGAGLGYGIPGPNALNEVRAQYGGFFLAIALTCVLALWGVVSRQTGLVLLAVTFGGILFGRLVSAGIDGGFSAYSPTIRMLFVVDAVGLVASAYALWQLR